MKAGKRLGSFALVCMLAVTACSIPGSVRTAQAAVTYTYEYEGTVFSYTVSDDEVEITAAESENTEIIVPDAIDDAAVTSIDSEVFKNNKTVVSITLPDSITEIGSGAFYGCSALTSIDLPDAVKKLESYTFYNCSYLAEVDFPENLQTIGTYAFYNCERLEELYFPDSLSTIYEYAFANCPSIRYILLPPDTVSFRDYNFGQCSNLEVVEYAEGATRPYTTSTWLTGTSFVELAQKLILPASMTSIESGASDTDNNYFIFFTSLQEIEVSEGNPYYASYDGCIYDKELTTLYVVPKAATDITFADTCETIARGSFANCTQLTELVIPDTVTTIESGYSSSSKSVIGPFYACTSLQKLEIPETVTSLGSYILSDYASLTDLSLYLDGVYYHFTGDSEIEELTIGEGTQVYDSQITDEVFYLFDTEDIQHTYYGSATKDLEEIQTYITSIVLSAGVTDIDRDIFDTLEVLESVEVDSGNTVYYSENGILYQYTDTSMQSLELVRYPMAAGYTELADATVSVGEKAFYYNTGISYVYFPEALLEVGAQAFYGCKGVEYDFTESVSLTTIGDQAFYAARNSKVLLPDSVTSIGEDAFYTNDDSLIVYGTPDSYVETYCEENDILFRDIAIYGTDEDTELDQTYHASDSDEEDDSDASDTEDSDNTEDADDDESSADADDSTESSGSDASDADTDDSGDVNTSDDDTDSALGENSSDDGSGDGSTTDSGNANAGGGSSAADTKSAQSASGGSDTDSAAVGSTVTVGKGVYKITSASTVTFVRPVSKNLKSITIPASVTINGISYQVTAIKASAFAKNKKLKTVVIGKNVKKIGKKAFYNCSKLKKVTFKGKKIKSIGAKAFKNTAKSITVKTPKAKKPAYKKLLKKAGLTSNAKIK